MEKDKEKLPEAAGKEGSPPIGEKQVEEAYQTLLRYRAGKVNLDGTGCASGSACAGGRARWSPPRPGS